MLHEYKIIAIIEEFERLKKEYDNAKEEIAKDVAYFVQTTRPIIDSFIDMLRRLRVIEIGKQMRIFHLKNDYEINVKDVYVEKIKHEYDYMNFGGASYSVIRIVGDHGRCPRTCAESCDEDGITIEIWKGLLEAKVDEIKEYVLSTLDKELCINCVVAQYIMLTFFVFYNFDIIKTAFLAKIGNRESFAKKLVSIATSQTIERARSRIEALLEELGEL